VQDIRVMRRSTQGVKLMNLGRGDRVVDVALVVQNSQKEGEQ